VSLSNRKVRWLRTFAVVAAAALVPVIAGCEAGLNAPTQQWHQPTAGASKQVDGVLRINNVFVLGAPPEAKLAPGSSAGVFLAMANSGPPDRLIAITAPGAAAAVQMQAGGYRIGTDQSVLLTGPAPQVILRRITRVLNGGQSIVLVLHFLRAGPVTMVVPVMPKANYFTTFSPAPLPPTPTPSPTHSGHPSPTRTASPSPSPTG
jgi:hypothetical protein